MRKVLVILLPLLGLIGGSVGGLLLRPAAQEELGKPAGHGEGHAETRQDHEATLAQTGAGERSFVKIGRQTIIPVVEEGKTRALMLFELAIDVSADANDRALQLEPRLRDAFLDQLLQMSYTGAFLTNFTDDRVIEELRRNLTRAAREHLGDAVREVLILDVMRQEL